MATVIFSQLHHFCCSLLYSVMNVCFSMGVVVTMMMRIMSIRMTRMMMVITMTKMSIRMSKVTIATMMMLIIMIMFCDLGETD